MRAEKIKGNWKCLALTRYFLAILITGLFVFEQPLLALDEPPDNAYSDTIMPVPSKLESMLTELEYRHEGCDLMHPCSPGYICKPIDYGTFDCPEGIVSDSGCGTCVPMAAVDSTGELTCGSGEILEGDVCLPNECGQCAGDPAFECGPDTQYQCVEHECPVEGTRWNGSACLCSDGSAPVNGSCDQIITLDKEDENDTDIEPELRCRATENYVDDGVGPDSSCLSGEAYFEKQVGEIIEIVGDVETPTGESCELSSPQRRKTACVEVPCPTGTVTSASECSDCYQEVEPGCFQCGALQTTVTAEQGPSDCPGNYQTSLSSCPASCGWQAEKTEEKTTYACPSGYTATGSLEPEGGEKVTVYCCANLQQVGGSCYDPDSGSLLPITGDTCTEISTGTDSMVSVVSATVTCSSPLPGKSFAAQTQGSTRVTPSGLYPLCNVQECTEES